MENLAIAAPMSRKDLRYLAYEIRKKIQCENMLYFPILEFAEWMMPKIYPGFNLLVAERVSMGNCHGKACPEEKAIYIRDDVYDGIYAGNGRDRLTLAHEVGHYVIHKPGIVAYARMEPGKKIPAYLDPEWQATAFGGELLIPSHLVKNLSAAQIADRCGVSISAAREQLKHVC